MDTPHHHAAPRRSSGDGIRSACCTLASSSSDPGSRSFTNLHAAACAVLCGGTPRACHPASVVVVACESGQRDSTACARHAHGALLRCGRVFPRAHPQPTRPPARHTLRRTHPHRDTSPHGCRCIVPLRTHAPLAARGRSDAGSARTLWTWRSPAARPWNLTAVQRIVCSTSCISHQLATSRHLQAPEPSTH